MAESTGLKKSKVAQALSSLADIGATEVKTTGKFVLPGLVTIKARTKAATKAGKRFLFGKERTVMKSRVGKGGFEYSILILGFQLNIGLELDFWRLADGSP